MVIHGLIGNMFKHTIFYLLQDDELYILTCVYCIAGGDCPPEIHGIPCATAIFCVVSGRFAQSSSVHIDITRVSLHFCA